MPSPAEILLERTIRISAERPAWVEAGRPGLSALVARISEWPRLLWCWRDLVVMSVRRDLEARFRGTLFGFAWVLAHPLLIFAIYAFIFTRLLGVRFAPGGDAPAATMGVYMFTGTLVWSAFADAVTRSTSCVLDNRNLVQKVRFPAELLPLQIGLSSLVTLIAGLAAFWTYCAATSTWQVPGFELLLWAPLLLLLQFLLAGGLGLALSGLHVLLRDTQQIVGVVLTIWMFATPIFWVPAREVLPDIGPWLPLIEANPLFHLVTLWREVLMGGEPALLFRGDRLDSLLYLAAWSGGLFAFGSVLFFRVEGHFADEV